MQSNGEHAASCQHHNSGAQQAKMVLPKKANNVSSDFTNFNNSNRQVSSQVAYQSPQQQQEQTYGSNRSVRTVLSQISEVNESNSGTSLNNVSSKSSTPILRGRTGEKSNGGVISQKVITIGVPNGHKVAERSLSPNLVSSQSIPITKVTSGLKITAPKAEEEKLDKLPPVPPSSGWSNRRNQTAYSSGKSQQQRRQSGKTSNGTSTDGCEQSTADGSGENERSALDRNLARQNFYLNNNISSSTGNSNHNNNDFNIQESGN